MEDKLLRLKEEVNRIGGGEAKWNFKRLFDTSYVRLSLKQRILDKLTKVSDGESVNTKALKTALNNYIYRIGLDSIVEESIDEFYQKGFKYVWEQVQSSKDIDTIIRLRDNVLKTIDDNSARCSDLVRLSNELEERVEELKGLMKCPDVQLKIALDIFNQYCNDNKRGNPVISAQIIRSAGLIISSRFGLKSIGGKEMEVTPKDENLNSEECIKRLDEIKETMKRNDYIEYDNECD